MPQVSVIIATRNRAWCLAETLDSVLAQDFPDFECIVVDDASTDGTRDLLARYPLVRVETLDPVRGVSAARNHGVALSSGEFIAFVDSDDLWRPGKLAAQIRYFAEHRQACLCQTQEIWTRHNRRHNPRVRHAKPEGDFFVRSLDLCLVSPSAVMMRRSLFERLGGFDESLPACEDYDLWLRVAVSHPAGLVDEPLVERRGGHPDQLSAQPGLDRWRIRCLVKILMHEPLASDQRSAALKVLKEKCRIWAQGAERRGRLHEAARYRRLADDPGRWLVPRTKAGPGV